MKRKKIRRFEISKLILNKHCCYICGHYDACHCVRFQGQSDRFSTISDFQLENLE